MDISNNFSLSSWMYSREIGTASARTTNSMNPLWSEYVEIRDLFRLTQCSHSNVRYTFPAEPDITGAIDLTAEEQPFFYNAHSGELSLEFPRAENLCRGGILA